MNPISVRRISHSPTNQSSSTSCSTRQPPPSPIFTPKRNHILPDRTSVSSSTSGSTSSTRDTLLLVSPTTPTKGGWYDDPASLVFEYLAPPTEDLNEWDATTPTHGKFQRVEETFDEYGMDQKGNTKSWWAGTTPTAKRRTIEIAEESIHAPDVLDYDDDDNNDAALGESPTLGRRSLISVWDELRAETGSFYESPYPDTEHGQEQQDLFSPVPRNTPSAIEDSPTIPVNILPPVPRISAPKREVPAASSLNQFMLGEGEWTARRLGKLREERYTQLGLFGGLNLNGMDHYGPSYPSTSRIHDSSSSFVSHSSSSSIKSSSTGRKSNQQAQPPPAIPKRSSSKRLSLVYPAVNPRQPPRPPARGSSLQTVTLPSIASSSSLSSYTSSASSSTGRSVRFNEQRSVSTPVRNASLTNLLPAASTSVRPVKRRTTTSSSFSTLETVLEAPRDLDVPPDPAWALRDPPTSSRLRGLHSRSQPDLHDHISGTMMQKLRMKRIASAASFSDKGERRKSFGTLSALTMLAGDETIQRNDKEGFMRTLTIRKSDKSRAASRALPAEWKDSTAQGTQGKRFGESHDTPPRIELAFVPSRPAPAPPLDVSDFDGCEEIHGEWYQSTIRAISLEASRAMRDAESWTWPHPPTRSPSIINTSESGSSLGGPITPSSSSFAQMENLPDGTTEGTPTQRQKRENEYGRDLLHGEEEFEKGQRKRMSMRIVLQDEMEASRKQNRLSLAPAWNGGVE